MGGPTKWRPDGAAAADRQRRAPARHPGCPGRRIGRLGRGRPRAEDPRGAARKAGAGDRAHAAPVQLLHETHGGLWGRRYPAVGLPAVGRAPRIDSVNVFVVVTVTSVQNRTSQRMDALIESKMDECAFTNSQRYSMGSCGWG